MKSIETKEYISNSVLSRSFSEDLLSYYKGKFYTCQFAEIIETVDEELKEIDKISDYYKLIMIKAKSFFELNRRDKANAILEEATKTSGLNQQADYYYTKGSFHYFKSDFSKAKIYFKNMLEFNQDHETVYKSLLALGNIAYSEKRKIESLDYLNELASHNVKLTPELRMSFKHLKANILLDNNTELIKAKELLEESYEEAIDLQWTFFAQRSLYNLAKYYKKVGRKGEALGILSILDMNLKTSDSRFLSLLVNKEFDILNHRSTQKLQLDVENKIVQIGNEDSYRLELGRWPILFKFLHLLFLEKDYVSKEKIAASLWPKQKYLPRTHDPRIYDVVKRLKQKLELIEEHPLLFEANAGGYRLNIS